LGAAPDATSSAVGVARPRAQGQAMMSTASAALIAWASDPSSSSQPAGHHGQRDHDGHEHGADPIGEPLHVAFPVWARSTSATSWASCVSRPTRVARTTRRPDRATVPPSTAERDRPRRAWNSPVMVLVSMAQWPLTTSPSWRWSRRAAPRTGRRHAGRHGDAVFLLVGAQYGDVLGADHGQSSQGAAGAPFGLRFEQPSASRTW